MSHYYHLLIHILAKKKKGTSRKETFLLSRLIHFFKNLDSSLLSVEGMTQKRNDGMPLYLLCPALSLFTLFTGRYQFGLKWRCNLAGCDRHSDKTSWTKDWAPAFAGYFPRGACWNRSCISTEGWRLAGLRGVAEAGDVRRPPSTGGNRTSRIFPPLKAHLDEQGAAEEELPRPGGRRSLAGRRGSLKFHRTGGSHADNPGDGVFLFSRSRFLGHED